MGSTYGSKPTTPIVPFPKLNSLTVSIIWRDAEYRRRFFAGIQTVSPLREDSKWSTVNVVIGKSETGSPVIGKSETGSPVTGKIIVVPARTFVNHVSYATVAGPESSCSPKIISALRPSRSMNVRARFQRRSRSAREKLGTDVVSII